MLFKSKIYYKLFIFTYISFFFTCSFVSAQDEKPYFDNVVIYKLKNYKSESKSVETLLSKFSNHKINKEFSNIKPQKNNFSLDNIYRVEFSNTTDIFKVIKELNNIDEIAYAEPLYKVYPLYEPNDPMLQTSQYWVAKIQSIQAWDICKGDTNIVIGISDTGLDFSHQDLLYNIKYNYDDPIDGIDNDGDGYIDNFRGWDFGDNDNNPQYETNQHGVQVAGIAGASTDNGIGVAGAGFNCKILPIKIANIDNILINTYQSIIYAAEHGCQIVNCSWGSESFQQMGQDVINYVVDNYDMLVVAGCGNTNSETEFYPASYKNVLSVAGTTSVDERWSPESSDTGSGSSYSYNVDVSAPSTAFYTTYGNNNYGYLWGGTSIASPIVAGCAGILRSFFPNYNAKQIKELIRISADNIDTIPYNQTYEGKLGGGRVNIYKALTMVQTPSIRFNNYSITYQEDKIIIDGNFTNYLANAENLTITAELNSFNASLETTEVFSGNLSTLETYISENQIIINLSENVNSGEIAQLHFYFSADDYSAKQSMNIILKQEFIDINTDLLSLSVTGKGRIGFNDLNKINGNGLILNNDFDLLSECSIIAGYNEENIFSSSQQISDFKTINFPTLMEISDNNFFDNNIFCEFNDSLDPTPAGLRYLENVYSKNGNDYKNLVFVEYQIINESNININNFYFGLFADWDLINNTTNSSIFNQNKNFMYCQNDGYNNMYAGIKLLSKQPVNYYSIPLIPNGNGTIDITDGFSNIEKFQIISTHFFNWEQDSSDIAISTSAGPFNINAGDTATVTFAIIAAQNIIDFNNAVDKSVQIYNEINNITNIDTNFSDKITVLPNISNNFINVTYYNKANDCYFNIINSIGEKVLTNKFSNNQTINIESLKSGLYNIVIFDNNKTLYSKFIKK
ncbi:MAG: S8 family peptidase [Bacteroidales bacterium]|jgi:hypothetical protein|nr:S8 family peptidase [Bacteroidales bacterium]